MSNDQSGQDSGHKKSYSVIVNGRPREVTEHKLTYLQVVQLAFPGEVPAENRVYTVTYSDPHDHGGSLVDGQDVTVKDGMVFNVRKTDKS